VNRIKRAAEALGVKVPSNAKEKLAKLTAVLVAVLGISLNAGLANAATLSAASVALSDPRPSSTAVNYTFTGSTVTSSPIQCIKATFSTSSSSVVTPTGFSAASATINAASSTLVNSVATGWLATPTANTVTYVHATTSVTPLTLTGATFVIAGITNSSVADTGYFFYLSTYNNVDCSTSPVDNAKVQFINTNGSTLSLTVDDTLSFTVNAVASAQSCDGTTTTQASTATTIPFGTVTAASNGVVCQDLTAATNATSGYTLYSRYLSAPTNGLSQTIADWTGTNSTPTTFSAAGTEAYGYTTNDTTLSAVGAGANRFTNGGQKWAALTATNAEVALETVGVTATTYRIGHQVGISLTTHPGTYTTTVIYTCTPLY
jgi:hypothetical protein